MDLSGLDDFALAELADDLAWFDKAVDTAPLTCALAWHSDTQTSQRKLVQALAKYKVILACGGNRCLGGETLIDNPYGEPRPIASMADELEPWVWAWSYTQQRAVATRAKVHPVKGPDPLYRVNMSDGSSFTATQDHRVLRDGRWTAVGDLQPGDRLSEGVAIVNITNDRSDYHYDLEVPELQNYRGTGNVYHHNSGKTWVLRCVIVALALGSDHPHARQYWLHHGCDPDAFPRGPGEVCLVALTSGASVEYHRGQVHELLPAGSAWWNNRTGRGPACVRITVPNYDKQAIIWFKSEDQGVDAFQGMSLRAVLHDEEGKTPKVWDECSVRLIDQDGWQMMANTPISGKTWVYNRFVRDVPPDVYYQEIWTEDNPFLPKNAVEKLSKQDQAASRLRGAWGDNHGLVYDDWNRDQHICTREKWAEWYPDIPWTEKAAYPDFPEDWTRFRTMDFGSTNPCVVVWFVYDPHGRIYVYRVIYQEGQSMAWWAEVIKDAERNERIEKGWADPAGAQEIRDLRLMDVLFAKANKAIREGVMAVREYMAIQSSDQRPNLMLIQGVSKEFIDEIEQYKYPERKNDNALPEIPIKRNDHVMDCLRYGVVGIRQWLGA